MHTIPVAKESMMFSIPLGAIDLHHNVSYDQAEYRLHCHPVYELYYFISGETEYLVDGHSFHLTPNSLLLMKPGTFHECRTKVGVKYERIALHFDISMASEELQAHLLQAFHAPVIHYQKPTVNIYRDLLAMLEAYRLQSSLVSLAVNARLALLLCDVYAMHNHRCHDEHEVRELTLPQKIIKHINLNFSEPITLEILSELFYISKNQICRSFLKATGRTVMDYLRQKRMVYADHLRGEGVPATEAAKRAGFSCYSTYYRLKQKREDA